MLHSLLHYALFVAVLTDCLQSRFVLHDNGVSLINRRCAVTVSGAEIPALINANPDFDWSQLACLDLTSLRVPFDGVASIRHSTIPGVVGIACRTRHDLSAVSTDSRKKVLNANSQRVSL